MSNKDDFNTFSSPEAPIPDYATADAATKAQMDALIATIEQDPNDVGAILQFGVEPIEQLGKLAQDLLQAQENFSPSGAVEGYKQILADLVVLQQGRDDLRKTLAVCLGAAAEVLKRYDTVYTADPDSKETFEVQATVLGAAYLQAGFVDKRLHSLSTEVQKFLDVLQEKAPVSPKKDPKP